jgi:molybdopterin converting factor small subunit
VSRLAKEATGRAVETKSTLARVMRAIEDGLYQPSMKARLTELEAEKTTLLSQKDRVANIPNISVHPNLAAVYRGKVKELETLLEDPEQKDEAMELIRSLIEKIELTPKEGGGVNALLHGDLERILLLCSTEQQEARQPKALRAGIAGGLLVRH